MILRDRVVGAVTQEGLSCRAAAKRFGIGISTAIDLGRAVPRNGQRSTRPDGDLPLRISSRID